MKTGYKVAPQQIHRIKSNNKAWLILPFTSSTDEFDKIIANCKKYLLAEIQLKLKFHIDKSKAVFLQQQVEEALIHFSTEEVKVDLSLENIESLKTNKKLNFTEGPIANCTFYKCKDKLILAFSTFSFLLDESSLSLLAKDLKNDKVNTSEKEEASISYLQYAVWQSQLLTEEQPNKVSLTSSKNKHGSKWLYPVMALEKENYSIDSKVLPKQLINLIEKKSTEFNCSTEALFLAVFYIVAYKLNFNENASLGLNVDGRYFDEIKSLKGVLSKSIPVQLNVNEKVSLSTIINNSLELIENAKEAHPYFEEKELENQAIQFSYQKIERSLTEEGKTDFFSPSSSFGLRYEVKHFKDSIVHSLRFSKEKIKKDFIDFLFINIQSTLEKLANTDIQISSISLGFNEDDIALTSLNKDLEFKKTTLDKHLKTIFSQSKSSVAIKNDEDLINYKDLESMACQVSHLLTPYVQGKNKGIAVQLEHNIDLPAILLGIWMSGAYYIPIEINCPPERLNAILEDSGAEILLTNTNKQSNLKIPTLVWSYKFWNKEWIQQPNWQNRVSDSIAYMIYTSGTSGKPKGVLVFDYSLINYTNWLKEEFNIGGKDSSSILSSYAFDLVYTALWGTLLNGGSLFIPEFTITKSAEELVTHIVKNELTYIKLTPSHLSIIKDAVNFKELEKAALKHLFLGGEPIQVNDIIQFKEVSKNCEIINHYGPTETTIGVIFTRLNKNNLQNFYNKPWIGKPIANTEIFILDSEKNCLGKGEKGELAIVGKSLSKGYHNRQNLNENKFIDILNPITKVSKRAYLTGDIAYKNWNNDIVLVGRSDNQIKINGHRIEPEEIKNSIKKLDIVSDCHVSIIEENVAKQIVAFVISKNNIKKQLEETLPKYLPEHMIPECVVVNNFPLTANGKIDTKKLIADYSTSVKSKIIIAPTNELEQKLSVLWMDVLKRDTISIDDDFFELGGDSIRVIQLVSKMIKNKYKVEVKHLFEYSTIKLLANFLNEREEKLVNKKEIVQQKHFRLSPLQEGMFFLSLIQDGKTHIIQREFELIGQLDINHFKNVLEKVVEEFPVLTSSFFEVDGLPMQKFIVKRQIPFQFFPLENTSEKHQKSKIKKYKKKQLNNGFNLTNDSLFVVDIWETGNNQYQLLLTYHHIILDGWCFQILAKKIMDAYNRVAKISNNGAPSYDKFIGWIENRNAGNDIDFWKNYLKDYSGNSLLKDFFIEQKEVKTYKYATANSSIEKESFTKLQQFCRQHKVTLGFVLQQFWGILLAKYTSREDVVFASTVSGRPPELEGSEKMMGLFINTIPYRVSLDLDLPIIDWLKAEAVKYPTWLENQYSKLSELQSLTSSKENLLKHLFVLENYPLESSSNEDSSNANHLIVEQKKGDIHLNYELALILYPDDNLKIQWIYNGNSYSQNFVNQLSKHLDLLIEQLINTPNIKLSQLVLEKQQKFRSLTLDKKLENKSFFLEQIEENLREFKDQIALKTNTQQITYKELDKLSLQLAGKLQASLNKNKVIGIYALPSIEMIVQILACLRTGITYVPLDPEQAISRLNQITSDSDIEYVITTESLKQKANKVFKNIKVLTSKLLDFHQNTSVEINENIQVYRMFTSGSTGKPKGCCITHKNLYHLFVGTQNHFNFSSKDKWIMLHSFGFDFSTWEIWGALWYGASLFLPEKNSASNPSALKKTLLLEEITVLNSTPGAFYGLIDSSFPEDRKWHQNLKYVIFGGDKLSPQRLSNWYKTINSKKLKLINMYGITETTVHNTFKEISLEDMKSKNTISPIGKPFIGVEMFCLDKSLNCLPAGILGELYIGGNGVSNGYYKSPDLTKKAFVNRNNTLKKLYKSGDLAVMSSSGEYYYIGRKDQQVQLRGFRIELEEIKQALNQHPLVKEVAVLKREGKTIEEDKIEAYYVPQNKEKKLTVNSLRSFLAKNIPWYMIPSTFIAIDSIPLTKNGKFNPEEIKISQFKNQKIKRTTNITKNNLLNIWSDVLNLQNIMLDDDFFDLGGNSLLAIRLMSELNKKMKLDLDVSEIFKQRTINQLAFYIDEGKISDLNAPYQIFNAGKTNKIYFFPPAIGFGFVFSKLALALPDFEVIAFNFIDDENLIEKYAKLMLENQMKDQKFILAGFSSGGSLAFEVIKELEKNKVNASDLILLDSKMNMKPEFLTEAECKNIADSYINDPRAKEYLIDEKRKDFIWQKIKKCAKFIHALENKGTVNTNIHLITSEENHKNTERLKLWQDATNGIFKAYKGLGKHTEMLDEQNFKVNKNWFLKILDS